MLLHGLAGWDDVIRAPRLAGRSSKGIRKSGHRTFLVDIGLFRVETFAADNHRPHQGDTTDIDITGSDAVVRRATEPVSMDRRVAGGRLFLPAFLLREKGRNLVRPQQMDFPDSPIHPDRSVKRVVR